MQLVRGGGGGSPLTLTSGRGGGVMLKEETIPRWCFSCMFHVFVSWLCLACHYWHKTNVE